MAAAAADASQRFTALTPEEEGHTRLYGTVPAQPRTEREREREREGEGGRASASECLVCGALFSSQDKLRLHALSHSGDKPFHCSQPHCPKAFSSKYKLFRHMATHSPQKSHQCTFCEKMFHRKDHLKNHLQTHDPNKEAFKCDECGKHYNTKLGYKRHVAMHSATSGDLTCKVCLQSYESTPVLLEHLKSHSGKSSGGAKEKKHPCDHCDRRFYTRKDVRRHMVVHTGRKDFLCQYCAQRFGRKDHLTRHVKKSHGRELLRVKSEPADLLEPGVYEPAGVNARPQPHSAFPGHGLDSESFPLTTQPFSLKYPLGFTSFSGSSQEHALKGDLDTYLMDLPSSSSASEPPLPPSSKLELDHHDQESKMSTSTAAMAGESLASSLMDFSQLFNFLPLNGPGYSTQSSGSGEASGSYRPSEGPMPLEDTPDPESAESADSSLQGLTPQYMSSLSSAPTLPRFHQAFQ